MFFFFGKSKAAVAAGGLVNLITNGTFDTDTDWTKGAGWTISGGVASNNDSSGSLEQTLASPLIEGHTYRVTFTLTVTSGSLSFFFWDAAGTSRNASGTYQETFVATAGDAAESILYLQAVTLIGTIDDVILEDIT